MTFAVSKVGHLVLRASDLRQSNAFYEVLGLHEVARRDFGEGPMAFLSTGTLITTWPSSRRTSRQGVHSTTSLSR